MAELKVAAEEDPEPNRQGKPAINKLKKMSSQRGENLGSHLRPEAMSLDFVVRPKSRVDPVRARAKQMAQDQRRMKMNKKLQQLKAPKRKHLQATKLSAEGCGMVKYL